MNNKIIKNAVINSVGTALYIVVIASFLFNAQNIFGSDGGDDKTIFIPVTMLLLFVLSAAITGSLVFGRSVLWYFEGQKKEALSLLAYTLGFLFVITILAMVVVYVVSS
jgi:hypothetical protein